MVRSLQLLNSRYPSRVKKGKKTMAVEYGTDATEWPIYSLDFCFINILEKGEFLSF